MTGEIGKYVALDGEVKDAPWYEMYVKTPYYTAKMRAIVLTNPIYDIVIENVIGAKNETILCSTDNRNYGDTSSSKDEGKKRCSH